MGEVLVEAVMQYVRSFHSLLPDDGLMHTFYLTIRDSWLHFVHPPLPYYLGLLNALD